MRELQEFVLSIALLWMSEESGQAPSWECHWDPAEPVGDGCGAVALVPSDLRQYWA